MTKNLTSFGEFKKKAGLITENVIVTEDTFKVRKSIDIPTSLVKNFIKKCKDAGSKDISTNYSEIEVAEILADYLNKYINIENFPVSLILGTDFVQPIQAQTQVQETPAQVPVQATAQAPVQTEPTASTTPAVPVQNTPETTASAVPAQEPAAI